MEPLFAIAKGDDANATQLVVDVHCGTHVDAPRHFLEDGATMDEVAIETFIGPALVVDTGAAPYVDAALLEGLGIPEGTERLLLRTRNSTDRAMYAEFCETYVGITLDAAEWLVARRCRLIGVDYLSVQRFHDPGDTHVTLLSAGVVILEGLDLIDAPAGPCELICLPMRVERIEASPARALIRTSAA